MRFLEPTERGNFLEANSAQPGNEEAFAFPDAHIRSWWIPANCGVDPCLVEDPDLVGLDGLPEEGQWQGPLRPASPP